jgi:hypothetical protein
MFGSVSVLGRVAAAYMAADETEPEMDPRIAHLQALLATLGFRANIFDFFAVLTCVRHLCALSPEQWECILEISCRPELK